jgi:ABC-type dipeptide/oligopeptide/nickel transport system permease subunit
VTTAQATIGRVRLRRRLLGGPTWVGLGLLGLVLGVALVGPYVAPHSPTALPGIPYATPSRAFPFGTDYLGEDVLSRVLWGGRAVIAYAAVATILAYLAGGTIGLVAGYRRSLVDAFLMRAMDVLLAFPPILFLLVVATGAGTSVTALVLAIAIVHTPAIARIVRSATQEVSTRGYVEAAAARGDSGPAILRREILPNILPSVAADAGPRFTVSILLVAAVNFLGLGISPPTADWALMISENRGGLTLQPWAVAVPALLIAFLTIAVNLVADAVARSLGSSTDAKRIAR